MKSLNEKTAKKICVSDILLHLDKKGVEYIFFGEKDATIRGYSEISNYQKGTITWARASKLGFLEEVIANYLGITEGLAVIPIGGTSNKLIGNILEVENPRKTFFELLDVFYPEDKISESKKKIVTENNSILVGEITIGAGTLIGRNCVFDGDVQLGENCIVGDNVTILNKVVIGNNTRIQSGVVIGEDGFACEIDSGSKVMITHRGGVNIGGNVHIGANSVIARGTIGDTVIGVGSKIDANCFIAHNVKIGENITLIAGTILYGSCIIEDNAYIASAIVRNGIRIGNNVTIGMGSVITKDIDDNQTAFGNPAVMREK